MKNTIRLLMIAGLLLAPTHVVRAEPKTIQVYKSPTCGCCQKWVDHLKNAGFTVDVSNVGELNTVKRQVGVPQGASSCHTAVVDGYFVEGHVPAEDVARLLRERPKDVVGIAVPGMPVGSPGMEGAYPEKYSTLAVQKDGKLKVFATHGP